MWYFAWVLGVGFAVLLSILNAMWNEAQEDRAAITGGDAGGSAYSIDPVHSGH
jgi:cytochrome bd-I ubiquinol oxidase subunit X